MDSFLSSYMEPINQIQEHLFIGGLLGANNELVLRQNCIQAVVQVLGASVHGNRFQGMEYHRIEVQDFPSANISKYIPDAVRFIHYQIRARKNVFIHCAAGISRSSSVAVAYLMAKYNINFQQALQMVKRARGCCSPNQGFQRQLRTMDLNFLRTHAGMIQQVIQLIQIR